MELEILTQKDYLVTEINWKLPVDLDELDKLLKQMKGTGRIVSMYSQGGVLGVNVEQRTKIPEAVNAEVRRLVGVETKFL